MRPLSRSTTDRFFRLISGPELFILLPAATLGAYWLGGEPALFSMAVLAPVIFALSGALRARDSGNIDRVDGLTGLYLRDSVLSQFDMVLAAEPDTGLHTACVMLEIDDFNLIPERHGHKATEDILVRISDRIQSALRDTDVIARLDSSCFAIALTPVRRTDLETLIQLSARLQTTVAEPLSLGATAVYVTASVGFCMSSRSPEPTGEAILNAADSALREARRNGPGAIRAYSSQMRQDAEQRQFLIDRVGEALESGEIRPWFQPQVSTNTGRITGFEALARWHHPKDGIIAPQEFLPAIEAAGLSERLGEVILFHSLTALRDWDRAGYDIPGVGVNFSGDELQNPKLADKIRWELDRFDLAPARLSVEILETVVEERGEDTITRNVCALQAMGCAIDLDDFGTGHSSISNIRRFAVKRIKIDRSFVIKVDEDPEQQKMVSAILTMAEQLGLDTLAEGVETVGEHAMLAQLGCGHIQGFNLARAMPFEETAAWIERHTAKLSAPPQIGRKSG